MTLSSFDLTTWVINFCNEIVAQRGPAAMPIIYTNAPGYFDGRLAGYDLWDAFQSTPSNDAQTGAPVGTGPFGGWTIWQYNVGPAGDFSAVDLDVLDSGSKSLASLVIPEPGTGVLALGAVGVLAFARRRRRCERASVALRDFAM